MKIREKLALYASAMVMAVLFLTGFLLYMAEKRELGSQQENHRWSTVHHLVRVCEDALSEGDDSVSGAYAGALPGTGRLAYSPLLVNYAKSLLDLEPLRGVELLGLDGDILFHSDMTSGDSLHLIEKELRGAVPKAVLEISSPTKRLSQLEGRAVLQYLVPVNRKGRRAAVLEVDYDAAASAESMRRALKALLRRFLMVGALCLAAGLLGSALLAFHFTRTLGKLVEGARRIGEGELSYKIQTERRDELGQVSWEFNRMGGRLAELDQMKKTFFHTITHDLKSPLHVISGYVTLLLESDQLAESEKARLKIVQESARRLNQMIKSILDVARMEAGHISLRRRDLRVKDLIDELRPQFSVIAADYGVALALSVPEGLPLVKADAAQIQRVLENLVSKALKFSPDGGVVAVEAMARGDGFVEVRVQDQGPGIPPDKLSRLFSIFSQVEETKGLARERGTGLGLVICKQLVEAHGGRIGVESQWKKGSVFFFTLPVTGGPGAG
ncbi:MAG: HAMP domain-containing histidine kinase [Elusimicrobia bacterium]|nr:HAMP domain-containing histidine kinase [Elusimicrobiota bacterium]